MYILSEGTGVPLLLSVNGASKGSIRARFCSSTHFFSRYYRQLMGGEGQRRRLRISNARKMQDSVEVWGRPILLPADDSDRRQGVPRQRLLFMVSACLARHLVTPKQPLTQKHSEQKADFILPAVGVSFYFFCVKMGLYRRHVPFSHSSSAETSRSRKC